MVIVTVDCYSRFITLYPVQSTRANIFAEVFLRWIRTFGSPKEILFLNKSEFELAGVDGIIVSPESNQENYSRKSKPRSYETPMEQEHLV